MRKYLYGTTALVAATLVAGTVHAAEPLKMGVSGNMQEWFGVIKNKKVTTTATAALGRRDINTFGINADTEVAFKGSTKLDNGMVVTGVIEIDADDNGASISVKDQWVSLGTAFGTAYAGTKWSLNHDLHNEAPDVGIGYSDVDIWVRHPTGGGMLSFGGSSEVGAKASSDQNNFDKTSFKAIIGDNTPMVGYVSPQFAGFTVAGTYSASRTAVGAVNKASNNYNAYDVTLAYAGEFGGVKIGADTGVAHRNGTKTAIVSATTPTASVTAYEGGLKVGYSGFTLGGAYMRYMEPSKNYGTAATGAALSLDGSSWNIGASYKTGPVGVSLMYYTERHQGDVNKRGSDKFDTYLLSGSYDLGPGIALKSSAFIGKYKSQEYSDTNNNNKGYGLVSGLDLTF